MYSVRSKTTSEPLLQRRGLLLFLGWDTDLRWFDRGIIDTSTRHIPAPECTSTCSLDQGTGGRVV